MSPFLLLNLAQQKLTETFLLLRARNRHRLTVHSHGH